MVVYLLLEVKPDLLDDVFNTLQQLEQVTKVATTIGPYDLIARFEFLENEVPYRFFVDNLIGISQITSRVVLKGTR